MLKQQTNCVRVILSFYRDFADIFLDGILAELVFCCLRSVCDTGGHVQLVL